MTKKQFLKRMAIDLGGSFLVGLVLALFLPIAVGVIVGVVGFVWVARPSIQQYREERKESGQMVAAGK
jgi:hypothetical protein